MQLQKDLLSSFLKMGMFKYSGEMLAFLGSIWISRLLTPGEYGIVAMIMVGYLLVARFSNPGFTDTVVREQDSHLYKETFQGVFVIHGLMLALVMVALAFPLSWIFHEPLLVYPAMVYGLILFLYALPNAAESYLFKKKQFSRIYAVELAGTVVSLLLTIGLAYLGFSYWSLILPQLFIPFIYLMVYRSWEPIPWSIPSVKELKLVLNKFRSLVLQLSKVNIIEYWEENTDNFWAGRLYGSDYLGIYSRAYLVTHLPKTLLKPMVYSVMLPQWQEHRDELKEIGGAYGSLIKFIISILSIPMSLVILFPSEISMWLWGKQWASVGLFLGTLGIVMGFQAVCSTSRAIFILTRKERQNFLYTRLQGMAMIIALTISAYYSLKVMAMILVLVVLVIKVPAYCYWCLHQCLNMNSKMILSMVGVPWVLCLIIWCILGLHWSMPLIYPLGLLLGWSLINMYTYFQALYRHDQGEKE